VHQTHVTKHNKAYRTAVHNLKSMTVLGCHEGLKSDAQCCMFQHIEQCL